MKLLWGISLLHSHCDFSPWRNVIFSVFYLGNFFFQRLFAVFKFLETFSYRKLRYLFFISSHSWFPPWLGYVLDHWVINPGKKHLTSSATKLYMASYFIQHPFFIIILVNLHPVVHIMLFYNIPRWWINTYYISTLNGSVN